MSMDSIYNSLLLVVRSHVMFLFQIGVVIEDKEMINSSMGGRPWKAGKFAFSLRTSLWSEHLGLRVGEVGSINFLEFSFS